MQREVEEAGLELTGQAADTAAAVASVAAEVAAAAEEEAAEHEALLREQLAQPAAAHSSGRGQQHAAAPAAALQQQQPPQLQQQRAQVVRSTRRHRLSSRTKAQASTTSASRRSGAAAAPSVPTALATADLAAAATVRTWLLDCSSRRARGSRQPMAAAPAADAVLTDSRPRGSRRLLRGPSSAAQPAGLPAAVAAVEGLSEETQADMQVLLNARLQLSHARRCRNVRIKTL